MYLIDDIEVFTSDVTKAISHWTESKLNELTAMHPRMKPAAIYLKRGLTNYLTREKDSVNDMARTLALFTADGEGKIDADTLIDDAVAIFKDMDMAHTNLGGFGIDYGKGEVVVHVPHNIVFDMLFGDLGQIKITTEDLLELKTLMKG